MSTLSAGDIADSLQRPGDRYQEVGGRVLWEEVERTRGERVRLRRWVHNGTPLPAMVLMDGDDTSYTFSMWRPITRYVDPSYPMVIIPPEPGP